MSRLKLIYTIANTIIFLLTWQLKECTAINAYQSKDLGRLSAASRQLSKLSRYHITVPHRLDGRHPRSLETLTQDGHLDQTSFVLDINEEELTLDLTLNKDLFPSRFIERSYLPDGKLLTRKPHRFHHCYYHGEIRDRNTSGVALSTCNGLSGVIILDGKTHYVEPLRDAGDTRHVVYTPDSVKRKKPIWVYDTGLDDIVIEPDQMASKHHQRSRRDVMEETKYVELFIVADYTEYNEQGRDLDVVHSRCKEMANAMDLIYRPLNMRVALIGVEVWNEGDQFEVSTNPTLTMQMFHRWRKDNLIVEVYNDNAQFVTGKSFDGSTVGMASLSVMCSLEKSGGVNEDHGVNSADVASTMAHEMGHNMGFYHDNEADNCECSAPSSTGCVMEPSSGSTPPTIFSSCSVDNLRTALLKGLGACLFNYPREIFQGPICGNGFLEKGEECDCGSAEECTNDCCIPDLCILNENATCANGECCEDCQLKVAGLRCRDKVNECDLPEYCTGLDNQCPGNVYRQNGEKCANINKDAVCYNGQCVTYNDQCQSIWGSGAVNSHDLCYDFNKQGNSFGNCGVEAGGSFTACLIKDIKCGKLMCDGGADYPIIGALASANRGYRVDYDGSRYTCKSASVNLQDDIPDPGYVTDGSLCGETADEICVDRKCQLKSDLNIRDCPFNCHGNGICNSQNHCHCDQDWSPPLCNTKGYGGSIDSGPARPQEDESTVPPPPLTPDFTDYNKEVAAQKNMVITLIVVFLVVVPIVIVGGIAAYFKRRQLHQLLCKNSAPQRPPPPKYPPKRPNRQGFTNVPKSNLDKADVVDSHLNNRQTKPRPDIVMSTAPINRESNVIYKPTTEPAPYRPPWSKQDTEESSRPKSNIVRRESSKKPAGPPPPVPKTYENISPARKAPSKPPSNAASATANPASATVQFNPAALKPSTAAVKPPTGAAMKPPTGAAMKPPTGAAMKPPSAAMKPPTKPAGAAIKPSLPRISSEGKLPKRPSDNKLPRMHSDSKLLSAEKHFNSSTPNAALKPVIPGRPQPLNRNKFNSNNSGESSSPGDDSKPTPPPRPESLRIKNFALPKQPPPLPKRPSSMSDPNV